MNVAIFIFILEMFFPMISVPMHLSADIRARDSLPKCNIYGNKTDIRARDCLPKGNIFSEKADSALINSLPKPQIYNDR